MSVLLWIAAAAVAGGTALLTLAVWHHWAAPYWLAFVVALGGGGLATALGVWAISLNGG